MRFGWFDSKSVTVGNGRKSGGKGLAILHYVFFALGLGDFDIHMKENGEFALITTKINNVINRFIRHNLSRFVKRLLLKENSESILNKSQSNFDLNISDTDKYNMDVQNHFSSSFRWK